VLPQYPNLEQHKLLAQGELAEHEPSDALEEAAEVAAAVGAAVAAAVGAVVGVVVGAVVGAVVGLAVAAAVGAVVGLAVAAAVGAVVGAVVGLAVAAAVGAAVAGADEHGPAKHPVPQYASVLPQYPNFEQHNPLGQGLETEQEPASRRSKLNIHGPDWHPFPQ